MATDCKANWNSVTLVFPGEWTVEVQHSGKTIFGVVEVMGKKVDRHYFL